MAWVTTLRPGEEIVIEDKTTIRLAGSRSVKILIEEKGMPPRLKVVKKAIGAADR